MLIELLLALILEVEFEGSAVLLLEVYRRGNVKVVKKARDVEEH